MSEQGQELRGRAERLFEGFLWSSRLVVMVAVLASLAASFSMFYLASADTWYMVSHLLHYASPELDAAGRAALRSSTITHVVEIVDGFLLATVMLIFALGLYELFISKIDQAERSRASRVLLIRNLDDLKARLGKVVLMILIVKYFEHALQMGFASSLELLYLAVGVALVALALYLSHAAEHVDKGGARHGEASAPGER